MLQLFLLEVIIQKLELTYETNQIEMTNKINYAKKNIYFDLMKT